MSIIKLEGIDLDIYGGLKKSLLEQGFDQTKLYTVPEAAALYRLVTKCCASGIVDYVNKLHLPQETRLTLRDIARLASQQEGCGLFCKAAGLSGPESEGKNVCGQIEIPDGKDGTRESNNDGSFTKTRIHQLNGYGKVTNFTVSSAYRLEVQVDTNTKLELTNIETGGDISIQISTAEYVYAGAGKGDDIKKADAIRTNQKVCISISTCRWAYFGICADTIEVDQISTCVHFRLHAMEFNRILYRQSTCDDTVIYVPVGTKFKLIRDVADYKVDCDESLIDAAATKEIQIKQVSTGVVHIKEECVILGG